ncbi:MAG TPA: hypothetical protein VK469_09020 [Candidatus Kapabacteria bacterium]|nr:hypothetical protein [Candidatus Kapabacteria bacterium]
MRQILFYASRDDKHKRRLETAIHEALPGWPIEFFTRLDELRDRFRNIVEPDSIAVLLVANYEELHNMQVFREFLTEIYVILVLPDWKENTIKLAHLLLPRFISQKTDDFADLKKVLVKMTQSPG